MEDTDAPKRSNVVAPPKLTVVIPNAAFGGIGGTARGMASLASAACKHCPMEMGGGALASLFKRDPVAREV